MTEQSRSRHLQAVAISAPPSDSPLGSISAEVVASQFKALANSDRVRLIALLLQNPVGEECGRVLAATIGLPETTVSHHLAQLRRAGFITSQRRGMHVYHRPHRVALDALGVVLEPHAEPGAEPATDARLSRDGGYRADRTG